jgi:hypothetical protein
MNCGNEILFNEIEKHSSICLKINNDILKVERNEEQFELINYKLKKINDHLNNIFLGKADSVTDILKNEIKLYGKELYKYITDSINIEEASLDRIDSQGSYSEGNVQGVTYRANVSKHTMSMNELYEFCKKVLNYANQQPSQPLTKLEGSETND